METPLKGGLNTPLPEVDFRGILPTPQVQATPNTVLNAVAATPSSSFGGGMHFSYYFTTFQRHRLQ